MKQLLSYTLIQKAKGIQSLRQSTCFGRDGKAIGDFQNEIMSQLGTVASALPASTRFGHPV